MKRLIVFKILFCVFASILHVSFVNSEPVNVESNKQLFIDFFLIDSYTNVELVMNPPVKRGVVIEGEHPWESIGVGSYGEVIDDGGLYRMWYESSGKEWDPEKNDYAPKGVTCYATSLDGIKWEKPFLHIQEFQGNMDNNIVLDFVHHGTVFKDPTAPPNQRYKTVIYNDDIVYCHGAYSPDGIHDWKFTDWRLNWLIDSQNMAFWDEQREKYVFYFRGWTRELLRTVVRFEADDFLKPWPLPKPGPNTLKKHDKLYPTITNEAKVVIKSDECDPRPSDFYNPSVVKYPAAPNVYFAFPSMFFHLPEPPMGIEINDDDFIYSYGTEPPYTHIPQHYDAPASPAMERRNVKTRNSGFLDIRLCTSRDGIHWKRDHREPYVSLGVEGEQDTGSLYMFVGMIIRGGKIYQYYTGNSNWHDGISERDPAIILLEQRLDGFVSADAAYEGGEIITKPIIFSGSELHLNINTSAIGSAVVGILDVDGNPFPDYDVPNCDVIRGNFIDKTVSWQDKSDVSKLAGKPVRLRFLMRGSKLFSFRFK
ncbi:MAG TPA: hypothetical protein ENH82_04735 [bacterium]|nr:hypothetical protein [bacterium]